MARKKEKVSFFEKEIIVDYDHAESILKRENIKFKFFLICTGFSLVSTILCLLAFTPLVDLPIFAWLDTVVGDIIFVAGVGGALLTGPIRIVKTIFKVAKFAWFIIPFFPFDLFLGFIALCIAAVAFVVAPVVFAAYNLYMAYLNKKYAELFIAEETTVSNTQDEYVSTIKRESQTFKSEERRCTNCGEPIKEMYRFCKRCGTATDN